MFSITPRIGRFTFLQKLSSLRTSARATAWGVVTSTAPSGLWCRSFSRMVMCSSEVPIVSFYNRGTDLVVYLLGDSRGLPILHPRRIGLSYFPSWVLSIRRCLLDPAEGNRCSCMRVCRMFRVWSRGIQGSSRRSIDEYVFLPNQAFVALMGLSNRCRALRLCILSGTRSERAGVLSTTFRRLCKLTRFEDNKLPPFPLRTSIVCFIFEYVSPPLTSVMAIVSR